VLQIASRVDMRAEAGFFLSRNYIEILRTIMFLPIAGWIPSHLTEVRAEEMNIIKNGK
jgi:hypothetical protein